MPRVFARQTTLTARKVERAEQVETVNGVEAARPGDWVVSADAHRAVRMSDAAYRALFRPVSTGRKKTKKEAIEEAARARSGPFTYRDVLKDLIAADLPLRPDYVSLTLSALAQDGVLAVVDPGGKKRARIYKVA